MAWRLALALLTDMKTACDALCKRHSEPVLLAVERQADGHDIVIIENQRTQRHTVVPRKSIWFAAMEPNDAALLPILMAVTDALSSSA
jgi:hypothetical protein